MGLRKYFYIRGFSPIVYNMPYIKVYIHFVFSTKNRFPFLSSKEFRRKVWSHIKENAKGKDIIIDYIGGYSDHCHCLVSLGLDQKIKDIMQLIKGESSFWINKERLCNENFQWQNDYFAASVSESHLNKTREYIKNQEDHHKQTSFKVEYDEFLKLHGFTKFSD